MLGTYQTQGPVPAGVFAACAGLPHEVVYAVQADGETATEVARFLHQPSHAGGAPREHLVVHEMLNAHTQPEVSIHIHAYQPDRHDDSVERSFARPRS